MDILSVSGVTYGNLSPLAPITNATSVPVNAKNIDLLFVNPKAAAVSNATNSPEFPTIPDINGNVVANNIEIAVSPLASLNTGGLNATLISVSNPVKNANAVVPVNAEPAIARPVSLNIDVTPDVAIAPIIQNTSVTFIPDTPEVAVPTPAPFIPFGSPGAIIIAGAQISAPVNANDILTETPVQVTLPVQNTNVTTVPDAAEVVVPTVATLPSAAPPTPAANPVSLLQNTTPATVPVTAEAVVPPPPVAIAQTAVSNPAISNVVSPVVSEAIVPDTTLAVTVPNTTLAAVPDTTLASVLDPSTLPPIAAFNTMAGEAMEINPRPEEDLSGIGNQGKVEAVMPPQPAFNNAAAESTEAKFKNNATLAKILPTGKRPRDYLRTINKRAQATDLAFKRQHLPYQFKVLTDGEENIYIDLSILDEKGNIVKHEKRDVTNESFGRLMDNISSGKGLLIDDLPQGH